MENDKCICCEENIVHQKVVAAVQGQMPDDELLIDLSELFKVFGDSTRIKIMYALLAKDMCVCDISDLLHMGQSAISHQLRILRTARLVKFRREGKQVIYALDDDHVKSILEQGITHISELRS